MTDKELKQRADDYAEMIRTPGWCRLIGEMEGIVNDLTDTVMNSDDACLRTKGRVAGIEQVINTPLSAINEIKQEQPQGQDLTGESNV